MLPLIEDQKDTIAELCRRHYVARLEVFGSAATGEFDPARSDIDFLVQFGEIPDGRRFDHWFELQQELAELFGRHVDLVEPGAMRNPYFIRRVNESRRIVYGA